MKIKGLGGVSKGVVLAGLGGVIKGVVPLCVQACDEVSKGAVPARVLAGDE